MKAPENRVFSIAEENKPVPGCTISELVSTDNGYYILHFSLAPDTSISAESYRQPKLWLVADGEMEAFTEQDATPLKAGKGHTSQEAREQLIRLTDAGIDYSFNAILGCGGAELWRENADATAALINAVQPHLLFIGTLHAQPGCTPEG